MAISRAQMGSQLTGNRTMKKTKKMNRGGVNRDGLANQIEAKRRYADDRESRPARQEAEYRAAQQRRREEGGLSRLAMIPEAVRQSQVRAMNRLLGSQEREAVGRTRAEANELERQLTDSLSRKKGGPVKSMKKGGTVRGDGKCQRGKTKGRFV